MKKHAKTVVPANPVAIAARNATGAGCHQKGRGAERQQQRRHLDRMVAEYRCVKAGGKPPVDILSVGRLFWNHHTVPHIG